MTIVAVGRELLPLRAWACIRLLLWYFGVQVLGGGILLVVTGVITPGELEGAVLGKDAADRLLLVVLVSIVAGAAVTWWRLRRNLRGGAWPSVVAALGWRAVPGRTLALAALAGAALAAFYLFVAIPYFFPPTSQDSSSIAETIAAASPMGHFYLTVAAVLIAPAVEEFLFRGVLVAGFGASWGLWPAITASTSLFALAHLEQIGSYWPAFLGIIIVAALALALRFRTRSLWPGIAMHTAYNSLVMAVSALGS